MALPRDCIQIFPVDKQQPSNPPPIGQTGFNGCSLLSYLGNDPNYHV